MANPQLENGFTRISNEILDHLCHLHLNGEAWATILFIIRKTYGFHKKHDKIPLSQIAVGTGLSIPNICRALRKLRQIGVIKRNGLGTGFNKNYDTWLLSKRTVATVRTDTVGLDSSATVGLDNLLLSDSTDSKDTIQKIEYKDKAFIPKIGIKEAWDLVKIDIEKGKLKYPNVNLDLERQKMINWAAVNSPKKNWKRFITNWLNKAMADNASTKNPDDEIYTQFVKDKKKAGLDL